MASLIDYSKTEFENIGAPIPDESNNFNITVARVPLEKLSQKGVTHLS